MKTTRKQLLTVALRDPVELEKFLGARLGLPEKSAARLVKEGAVWRGGRRAQPKAEPLRAGERIVVYLEAAESEAAPARAETSAPEAKGPSVPIVFSDERILVVDKPAGLPSQPGRRGGPSLLSLLPPPLFLVHRLDAEASGLLVLARDRATAATLQQSIGRGGLRREYLAIVQGAPPRVAGKDGAAGASIALRIGKQESGGASPMTPRYGTYPEHSTHGLPALTHYFILPWPEGSRPQPDATLLWLRLCTGRTHQIRVHLAALGHPIVGDRLYGGRPAPRLYLHAARLRLPWLAGGGDSPRLFFAPPPADFGLPVDAGASGAPAWQPPQKLELHASGDKEAAPDA